MTVKKMAGVVQLLAVTGALASIGCTSYRHVEGENLYIRNRVDGVGTLLLRGRAVDPISHQPVASATVEIVKQIDTEFRSVAASRQSDASGEFEIAWEQGWWSETHPKGFQCYFSPFTLVVWKDGYLSYIREFGAIPGGFHDEILQAGMITPQPMKPSNILPP